MAGLRQSQIAPLLPFVTHEAISVAQAKAVCQLCAGGCIRWPSAAVERAKLREVAV